MNYIKRIAYQLVIPTIGRIMVGKNLFCNVIYYHDIVIGSGYSFMRTNINLFKKQMKYLAENCIETMRFDDLSIADNLAFKQDRVLITFDDGWRSNYIEIYDFMKDLGLKYNVFLAVGQIGQNAQYLTWDMVRTMHQSGLCGFGTHTFSHKDVSELDDTLYQFEIKQADEKFFDEMGFPPKDFCFPYGRYSKESVDRLIAESEYERIYLSSMSYSFRVSSKYIMGRSGISNDDPMIVFKNKVRGYYNAFASLIR